ncbi:S-layer homology domain-containing protein [Enorma phocaeensis]|uniref:S-layer homology domain-containing protein n=1 Tax=Enorma phocaeensis TaxID=1871019 RepID=A0ABT7V7E5_9ACTN|nr:S-layer homology domain-containing protein [Enorma phocaeensis]MDM8274417.1 S-layer homology domain-containing protein [Enorma phocaeensis]
MRSRMRWLLCVLLLCLGLWPTGAYAANGGEGYTKTVDPVTGTTTYTFTDLAAVDNFSEQVEGDVVLDFTPIERDVEDVPTSYMHLSPQKSDATVTIRGNAGVSYGDFTINIRKATDADLLLEDFALEGNVGFSATGEGEHKVTYDGMCALKQVGGGSLVSIGGADGAAHLSISWLDSSSSYELSGNFTVSNSLVCDESMTIDSANITFLESSVSNVNLGIAAKNLAIENSTINGVGHIDSFERTSNVDAEDFTSSSLSIEDSRIAFNANVWSGNSSGAVLGNSQEITIADSVVYGIVADNSYGCLGGTFESLSITGSEVYAQAERAAAIGLSDSAYSYLEKAGVDRSTITIENSQVEAASTYGAAIGMPSFVKYGGSSGPESDLVVSIIIKGESDVTATSIRSAAIGAGTWSEFGNKPVDGVEIEVGAGDIGWGGPSGLNLLSMAADLLGLSGESELEGSLATEAGLQDACEVKIEGSPAIHAKSGVMAVYADKVSVNDTNLVQNTMVIASAYGDYSIYAMETPGAVTIGEGSGAATIGVLGNGYASVATTGVAAYADKPMHFGDAKLVDAAGSGSDVFTVRDAGFQRFLTTPEIALSGTATLKGQASAELSGYARVGDTLTVDTSGVKPAAARSNSMLTYQWNRDGEKIGGASGASYRLTDADNDSVITCVVSGEGYFTGSVTSNAIVVSEVEPAAAPTMESRTVNSITLKNAGEGYEYQCISEAEWQTGTEFTGLEPGTAYTFIQKDSNGAISAPATFYTLSEKPEAGDFVIDYVSEALSFPSGVNLYSDTTCNDCLNATSGKLSIDISGLLGTTINARYATADPTDTESVTTIAIPARPAAPTLEDEEISATENSISFTGDDGVTYRLTLNGMLVAEATGSGQAITFNGLASGTTYTIEMRSEASNETKKFRSEVASKQISTIAVAPTAPTLRATTEFVDEGYEAVQVNFSWNRASGDGIAITGYAIYAQEKGTSDLVEIWSGANATSCSVATGRWLQPGKTYSFTLVTSWSSSAGQVEAVSSEPVEVALPALRPDPADFTIDYVNETITAPEGMDLYADDECTKKLTLDESGTANITQYIFNYGESAQHLYARSSTDTGTDSITPIEIPCRPYVGTISDVDLTVGYNSIVVDIRYLQGDALELYLGDELIKKDDSSSESLVKYEDLKSSTAYTLVLKKAAVASSEGVKGSFSSSVSQSITTKACVTKNADLLVPAGVYPSRKTFKYDLSDLLGGASIVDVTTIMDDDFIWSQSYDTDSKKGLRLTLSSVSAGETATVQVEAQQPNKGDFVVITFTVKAVDVAAADGDNSCYWVRTELSEEDETAVESVLEDKIYAGAQLLAAFDLAPVDPVGAVSIENAGTENVAWSLEDLDAGIDAKGTFDVYRIENETASSVSATRGESDITFTVSGGKARYAVLYTPPQSETYGITAGSTEHGTIKLSGQSAAEGTAVTVTLEPKGGYKVNSVAATAASGGLVQLSKQSEGTYTFTMPASAVTVSATFVPIDPTPPVLTVMAGDESGTAVASWTQSTENGATITGYELAVALDGTAIAGSPFSITPSGANTYTVSGLTPGKTYSFTLTAKNHEATADSDAVTFTVPKPEDATYTVTVAEQIEGGSLTASPATTTAGTNVTITATPDEGYEVDSITVTDKSGSKVDLVGAGSNSWSFSMPESDVTVSGTFKKVAEEDEEESLNELLEEALENSTAEAVTISSGTYKLTDNLSVRALAGDDSELKTTSLYIGGNGEGATVNLDLQGYSLDSEDCAIIVVDGSTLNLYDSGQGSSGGDDLTGSISGKTGLSFTDDDTEYVYAGGVGVYGTFNMYGGSITGNTAGKDGQVGYGGGVYVFGGATFNMYGGTISGNTATTHGGGVAVRSAQDTTPVPKPLYVDGAEISGWVEVDGGDVAAELSVDLLAELDPAAAGNSAGTFNLYGGTITGNTAPVGGGIYAGGTVNIGQASGGAPAPAAISVMGNASGNLYVPTGITISLDGVPVTGSRIGVTMEQAPGLFAKAADTVASSALSSFTSDNGSYYVTEQQDGLALTPVPVSRPTYPPEIEIPGGGGSVSIDPERPHAGDEVTITPEPDEGKVVDSVTVTDKDGELVEVTDNGDGTWSFTQPSGKVTITVTFACDGGELCPSAHLVDVDQDLWYHEAIDWAVESGLMSGYADGSNTFGPDDTLTRAQLAQILYNQAGKPEADPARVAVFSDCSAVSWYAEAVAWAASQGLMTGYDDGTGRFGPEDELTREQLAAVFWRIAGEPEADADLSVFPDGDSTSAWALEPVEWAVETGLLKGYDDTGELDPLGDLTRAQAATVFFRLAGNE